MSPEIVDGRHGNSKPTTSVRASTCSRDAAARPLAVQDRDPFLQEVAARLAALPHLGDGVVHRMCAEVQRRHWNRRSASRSSAPLPRKYGTL
jgi:hypothetical protein